MRGQISIEFSILLLAGLIAILIASTLPGIDGLDKTAEVSSMSLAHAAVAKMKQNIEMVSAGDVGTKKVIYIKSPPGNWTASGHELRFYRTDHFDINISTNCSLSIIMDNAPINVSNIKVITVCIEKINNTHVNVTIIQ
jgi:uncharacterized protein (UPF0333 family)